MVDKPKFHPSQKLHNVVLLLAGLLVCLCSVLYGFRHMNENPYFLFLVGGGAAGLFFVALCIDGSSGQLQSGDDPKNGI